MACERVPQTHNAPGPSSPIYPSFPSTSKKRVAVQPTEAVECRNFRRKRGGCRGITVDVEEEVEIASHTLQPPTRLFIRGVQSLSQPEA